MEMKALNPSWIERLQSRIAVQSAPLWLMNPMLPGNAKGFANVAFKPMCGSITPTQFGPMIRIFPRRLRICFSSSAPAGPHSLNPAEMITAPFTSAAAHSATIPGTVAAGVAITARSTFLWHVADCWKRFLPEQPRVIWIYWETRDRETIADFPISARPTLPGFSLAPISATDFGASIALRIGRWSDTTASASALLRLIADFMIHVAFLSGDLLVRCDCCLFRIKSYPSS